MDLLNMHFDIVETPSSDKLLLSIRNNDAQPKSCFNIGSLGSDV